MLEASGILYYEIECTFAGTIQLGSAQRNLKRALLLTGMPLRAPHKRRRYRLARRAVRIRKAAPDNSV